MATSRNPPWQRDELILALDLYFRHRPRELSQTHEEIVRLSEILNRLPIHADSPQDARFRNPNGVYMKLCNFLRYDPEYEGRGLTRGGKLEDTIWAEFSDDRTRLHRIARAIVEGTQLLPPTCPSLIDEDEQEFPEGKVLYRLHRMRERNRPLVERAKRQAETLCCVICDFDFFQEYGEIGRGFIECHHTLPVSEYGSGAKTQLKDLALVCANCHRMLHRRRPWLTIDELLRLRRTT